ncbi:hypothetical protein ACWCXH_36695 [Kitasatospora sp. NPDC001660]
MSARPKVVVVTGASSGFDSGRDGSEVVSAVYDRVRAEFFHRIGIDELLTPRASL